MACYWKHGMQCKTVKAWVGNHEVFPDNSLWGRALQRCPGLNRTHTHDNPSRYKEFICTARDLETILPNTQQFPQSLQDASDRGSAPLHSRLGAGTL